jgi:hypothetical protein
VSSWSPQHRARSRIICRWLFSKTPWISFITLGHPECWTSCRMVQDPRRYPNHTPSFLCLFERLTRIEREFGDKISACVSYSTGLQHLKRELGNLCCRWRYRLAVSLLSFR